MIAKEATSLKDYDVEFYCALEKKFRLLVIVADSAVSS